LVKEKVLVIGLGEVGRPLYELLKQSDEFLIYGFDVDDEKVNDLGQERIPDEVDIVHVCIPCFDQQEFVKAVVGYASRFKPRLLIVNSTVPPETTQKIHGRCSCLVAHSPVRGVHRSLEHMKWELKRWTKYVGGASAEAGEAAFRHFDMAWL